MRNRCEGLTVSRALRTSDEPGVPHAVMAGRLQD
jgi:hypothetical protein